MRGPCPAPSCRPPSGQARRPARWLRALLLALGVAILLEQRAALADLRGSRGLQPVRPEAAQPSERGPRYVHLPAYYAAPLYRSPIDGELLAEWPGGTALLALGSRFDDGRTGWQLVSDPSGNAGWVAELFLDLSPLPPAPPVEEVYLAAVSWEGEIVFCVNPSGGPPGLDGDAFVALVEEAAARWQALVGGILPLRSLGRCAHDPTALGDGVNAIGWVDDLGLTLAGQAWPNASAGTVSEIDVRLSRGYFERLQARDPSRTLRRCVRSTLVHEIGHLLGLDHPRSRALPSSMQGVGAARCDKSQPTAADRASLLLRYGPD